MDATGQTRRESMLDFDQANPQVTTPAQLQPW
jgi:hypothetical protein